MRTLLPFTILVFLTSTLSASADTIKVYAVCKGSQSEQMTPDALVQKFKTEHNLKSAKVGSSAVACSDDVTLMGTGGKSSGSKFFTLEISESDLRAFAEHAESEFKPTRGSVPPPKNLAEIFQALQLSTQGRCDFLVPAGMGHLRVDKLQSRGRGPPADPTSTER